MAPCIWAQEAFQMHELEASRVGLTEYRTYRDNKWQIGSGMIEFTAKPLVGIRLKRPGMHWSPAGASAITKL